ncbi:MAG: InlB B-repeat-containing protein [Lachnospiraceae bacterium]|nr:InlB B-repeat-containing protein [Lachnospiraceae bacterium]
MKIKGRAFKSLLSFATVIALVSAMSGVANANNENSGSSDLKVDYHTKYEISNYITTHPADAAYTNKYSSNPNTSAPYAIGRLSDDTLNGSLVLLNTYRYIAGIPSNVTLNETYNQKAQAAALVNSANGKLSHSPDKPSDMNSDIFDIGYAGASNSNLAAGMSSIGSSFKQGWMCDSDSSNIDRVGHRRWVLDPRMTQTGFGIVYKSDSTYKYFSAMYSTDHKNSSADSYDVVAWPAQNTPVGYFLTDDPWSISLNEYIDTANVTLTCVNTGQSWTFSGTNDCKTNSGSGYININNDGYGQKGCIIFRPSGGVNVSKNYSYNVTVSGQKYEYGWVSKNDGNSYWEKTGNPINYSISYTVDFFDIDDYSLPDTEKAKVTLDPNGGTGVADYIMLVKNSTYGDIPTPVKEGHLFLGWFTAKEGGNKIESKDICTGNITLYAHWTDQAPYKVKHYIENLSGNFVFMEEETLYGKINSLLSDCSKSFEGFGAYTMKEPNNPVIVADGSTVISFYYPRNSYTVSWDPNGGQIADSYSYSDGTYKYEERIEAPSVSRAGYYLEGWSPEYTGKMPAKDTKYVAVWKARNTGYDIEYYLESLDGSKYDLQKVLSKYGSTDSEVTPEVLEFEGFTSPEAQTVKIKGDASTVVQYYYKRNSYRLTWDFDGGTCSGSYTQAGMVKYGAYLVKPYPSKSGYRFRGWEANASGIPVYMPACDLTLKAVYTANENAYYKVEHYKQNADGTYNSTPDESDLFNGSTTGTVTPAVNNYDGFDSPAAQTVEVNPDGSTVVKYKYPRKVYLLTWDLDGGSAEGNYTSGYVRWGEEIIPPVPTKKGCEFDDWSVYSIPKTMPKRNLTIKAYWRAGVVTVTFDVNGGKALTSSSKTLTAYSKYGELPTTSRTGYTFAGWYTAKSGGTKVTAESICEGDITLYARWSANTNTKYTVEHYKQKLDGTYNKTASEKETLTGTTNASVTPAVKEYTGYTSPATQTVKIKADGTLVVKYYYTRNSYKLTWNLDGGSTSGKYTKGSVIYATAITAPVPVKPGYTFAGWNKTVPAKMPAKNLKITALWTVNYSTVTFNVNGGKALAESTKSVQENTAYGELPKASRTGYTFSGWYTAKSGGTKVTAESICEGDITLYARWKAKTNTKYTVEHYKQKLNGKYNATPSETESLTGTTNASITPALKIYKGYISPSAQTVKIKADGSLVVKYYYERQSYTLTWDFAGGSASGIYTSGSIKYASVITQPVPTRKGYVFKGWDIEVPEKMPAKDLTIKALWKYATDTPYKVEHYRQKVNGSYNATPNETESFKGKTNSSVTPEVKTYKGFTSPEVKTVKIKANGTLVVKYYYTRNSYNLTWNLAGGSAKGGYTEGKVVYGAAITAPVPTRDGYVFTGWDKTVAAKMPAGDVTYKAKWRKATKEDNVRDFVERFYVTILGRASDEAGLNSWTQALLSNEKTGADIAAGLFNSAEFKKKKMTDKEYINTLYVAIIQREADTAGYEYWLKEIKSGKSRDDILRGFINSAEFNNLCKQYGINAGSY